MSIQIEFDQLHADLMYPLQRIGYTGGLKAIEQMLGVTRSRDMAQGSRVVVRSGSDTHECGSADALELLLKYNGKT